MSFTINFYDSSTTPIIVANGTVDNSTSLTLIGKNYAGYGEPQNENFLHLLENFASPVAPAGSVEGQLWWDKVNNKMFVKSGAGWRIVGGTNNSSAAPTTVNNGELWWDPTTQQLKSFNGSSWDTVGLIFTATQGQTGERAVTVNDNLTQPHVVSILSVGSVDMAVVSKDPTFTTTDLDGFSTIKPGINLKTSYTYYGNSENALSLGGVLAANYLRSDVASSSNYPISTLSNDGITIGASSDFTIKVVGNAVKLVGNVPNRDLVMSVTLPNGTVTDSMTIVGANGSVIVANNPSNSLGVATKQYVDSSLNTSLQQYYPLDGSSTLSGSIAFDANGQYSIGSPSAKVAFLHSQGVSTDEVVSGTGAFNSLTLSSAITANDQAVTKIYVDTNIQNESNTRQQNINTAVSTLLGTTPTLNTLSALSQAVNNSANFGSDVNTALSGKAPLVSPSFSGAPTSPTPITTDNSARIATTAFVSSLINNVVSGTTQNLTQYALLVDPHFSKITIASGGIATTSSALLDIGSVANSFRTVYATTFNGNATTANYADLAEMYVSDSQYEPGTVLVFGGEFEVTKSNASYLRSVAGVVSTKPAHLMNSNCEGEFVVALALQGRCPVKVAGPVCKGDLLVSADDGRARVDNHPECGTVLGKSLENFDGEYGIVEISVGRS